MREFFAPGKLMLSGEYSVLHGAKAVAVPTRLGQSLKVLDSHKNEASAYKALDHRGELWLDFDFAAIHDSEGQKVVDLIKAAGREDLLEGKIFQTQLEFPRNWGLGSSSTFVALMAQALEVDVWPLFFNNFKGSGYDVAVAISSQAIEYQLTAPAKPLFSKVGIPDFFSETCFVYLGQKQNSAREVGRFLAADYSKILIQKISDLSEQLLVLEDTHQLEEWMQAHEHYTSEIIGREPLPQMMLPKISGKAKSLGAWGGDFIWLSRQDSRQDLLKAGFDTIIPFSEMIAG